MPGADRESTCAPGGVTVMPVRGGVAALCTAGAVPAGTEPRGGSRAARFAVGAAAPGPKTEMTRRRCGCRVMSSAQNVRAGHPTRRAGGIDPPLRGRRATTARQPNNAYDPTLAVWLDTCAARMQPAIDKPRFSPLKFLQ